MRKKGNWHYTSLCFEWQCSNTWFIGEWCNCLLVKYGATFFVIWWRTHTCFYTRLCPGVRICQTAQTFNNVTFVDTHTCTYSRSTQINTMNHVLSNHTITVTRNYLETGLNVIRHFSKINHSFWLTGIPFDRNIYFQIIITVAVLRNIPPGVVFWERVIIEVYPRTDIYETSSAHAWFVDTSIMMTMLWRRSSNTLTINLISDSVRNTNPRTFWSSS